jgi:hypothetical protein
LAEVKKGGVFFMTNNELKKITLWMPLLLFFFNTILMSCLVEELLDATEQNYGFLGFLTPIFALISFLYIRKFDRENHSYLVRILQGLNCFFIIFPITVFMIFVLAFLK